MEPDSSYSPFSSDPRARILWKLGSRVVRSGRRVPVPFLDFGIWETFFVPVDPASPCRTRSQTVLLDRARFQNSSSRSSSHAGDVPPRARSAKSSPRSTTSAIFSIAVLGGMTTDGKK